MSASSVISGSSDHPECDEDLYTSSVLAYRGRTLTLRTEQGSSNAGFGFDGEEDDFISTSDHVLIQGERLWKPYPELKVIEGFHFIEKNLKHDLKVIKGNALQLHAARHILGGRNCFLIGSSNAKAGKSLSYLIPIISKLLQDTQGYKNLEGYGPLAIIVCSTHVSGIKLEECLEILTQNTNLKWIFMHEKDKGNSNESGEDRLKRKLNGKYDIILATAEFFADLIEDPRSDFTFDRLSFLVFDDAHILLKYRQAEVQTILKGFKTFVHKLESRACLHQIIFCSSQWTSELEECFIHVADLPVLIINSPVQAIRYCNFDVRVVEANVETRFQVFKDVLSKHKDIRRIIVVANQFETLKELNSKCTEQGIVIHILEGEGNIGHIMGTAKKHWKSSGERVIIATTDVNLRELKIKTASMLIHYDIPEDDLRTFSIRFSTMWSNVRDLSQKIKHPQLITQRPKLLSYAILQSESPVANAILWKLHSLGASISKPLLDRAKKEKLSKLEKAELCPGFKCMGSCTELDVTACSYRHHFVEQDFLDEPILPRVGQVELVITEPISPNLYNAKVLRYCERDPVSKKITKFIDYGIATLKRHEELKRMIEDNTDSIRKGPSTFAPGTKVVVALREKHETRFVYTRGQIVKVATRGQFGEPLAVRVKCLDIGQTLLINVDEIFAMPESMLDLPAYGVQVVLANTAPPYREKQFRAGHNSKTKDFFVLDPIFHADIALSIGNTIWVKRLVQLKKLVGGRIVETQDVTYKLKKQGILVQSPCHLDQLYAECEKLGFSCDIYRNANVVYWFQDSKFQEMFYQLNEPYYWAYLRIFKDDGNDILSATASTKYVTPNNQVFVSLTQFEPQIESLEIRLDSDIKKMKIEHNWNEELHFHRYYEVDLVVAVKDSEDDIYRRGVIKAIKETTAEQDVEYRFTVFLVDLGVTGVFPMSSLFPIPKLYVDLLPFQIIKLLIKHIIPRKPKFPGDLVYRRTAEFLMPNLQPIDVEVVALRLVKSEEASQCSMYEAMIFGDTEEVGEKLVREKFAHFVQDGEGQVIAIKSAILQKFQNRVDQNLVDEDEDSDSEFDVNFDYPLETLLPTIVPESIVTEGQVALPAIENGGKHSNQENHFKEISLKIQKEISSASSKCISRNTCPKDPTMQQNKSEISIANNSSMNSDSRMRANVVWCQEDNYVYLRVLIPDVRECTCKVAESKKEIVFDTVDPPNYGFNLKLSKRVEMSVQVKTLGQYCEIKLTKRLPSLRWEVLTNETKLRWLMPEQNFQDEDDDDNGRAGKKIYQYDEVNYDEILEQEYDSDENVIDRETEVEEDLIYN